MILCVGARGTGRGKLNNDALTNTRRKIITAWSVNKRQVNTIQASVTQA